SAHMTREGGLWAPAAAHYGWGQPRLLAFDLETNAVVHEYDFPSEVAGLFSMLNDFQVDPAGQKIYIAESNPIRQKPALIVYDIASRTSRRLLERHPSVQAKDFVLETPERRMFGHALFPPRLR